MKAFGVAAFSLAAAVVKWSSSALTDQRSLGTPSRTGFRLLAALALYGGVSASAVVEAIVPAHADVIYSTFGPGDSYDLLTGYVTGGPEIAASFTIGSSNVSFDSVTVALGNGYGITHFALMTEQGGIPGAVLETFSFDLGGYTSSSNLYTFNSILHPILEAGKTYFIDTPCCQSDDGYSTWQFNTLGLTGVVFGYPGIHQSYSVATPAFRVEGAPEVSNVPLPPAWPMMIAGLAGVAALLRRRKRTIATSA